MLKMYPLPSNVDNSSCKLLKIPDLKNLDLSLLEKITYATKKYRQSILYNSLSSRYPFVEVRNKITQSKFF